MTGPSLKSRDAHSSIHEAALHEAKELTRLFDQCLRTNDSSKALHVADILIEHWESRTLKHAESEEEGLYRDIAERSPEYQRSIVELTRDHNLMRKIVHRVKNQLQNQEPSQAMSAWLEALIIVDELHNEDEMALVHALEVQDEASSADRRTQAI